MRAAAAIGLEAGQLTRLKDALAALPPPTLPLSALPTRAGRPPRFDLVHLLWYMGALIVLGSMGLFSTMAFGAMGGPALTVTALVYAALFAAAGRHLWDRRGLRVPGGLMIVVAVAMAPLAVFGMQQTWSSWGAYGDPGAYRGFFMWIKGSWVPMEVATIVAGLFAIRSHPFPFIVAVIAFALWFLSMDVAPWLYGTAELSWADRRAVSLWFGLAVLIGAWLVDLNGDGDDDFAFWLHLAGLVMFWGALSLSESSSEIGKAVYGAFNLALIALSVFLMRRTYALFGAIGVSLYLGHLAYSVFEDSLLFPFALSSIGVLIIAAGLALHRRRMILSHWMAAHLPETLRRLRPPHASLSLEHP
jgi:hypothetical protein